ncbi:MAG: hypothetical protein ACE5F6_13690 [Anaerolineae bacterium]
MSCLSEHEATPVDARQLQRILTAISLTGGQELTCAGLDEDRLAAYADLELAGHDPAARMAEVHRHLALCPDCRQDYQDVLATLRLERAGEWREPGSEPVFDLSFLPREPAAWSQVAERVRRFAADLPVLLLYELDRLPAGLQLSPAGAAAPRLRGPEADTPIVAFRLTDADERFAVDLRFRRAGEDVVWIDVRPLDAQSEEPLPGAIVGLHEGDGRLLEMRTVPAEGAVQLRDVPIDRGFLLRLEHDGRIWEIPFSLHIESHGEQ